METTPRLNRSIESAKQSLSRFGGSHVSSAHLVLGLLALQAGVAVNVLRNFGVSTEAVENFLSMRRSVAEDAPMQDGSFLGKSALMALKRAEIETKKRETTYVGTEHLLLGILAEESGEAADLFASLHVDRVRMTKAISDEIAPMDLRTPGSSS
jgi:ATP-dependent Clp protease ATP-binding subunit ClpC